MSLICPNCGSITYHKRSLKRSMNYSGGPKTRERDRRSYKDNGKGSIKTLRSSLSSRSATKRSAFVGRKGVGNGGRRSHRAKRGKVHRSRSDKDSTYKIQNVRDSSNRKIIKRSRHGKGKRDGWRSRSSQRISGKGRRGKRSSGGSGKSRRPKRRSNHRKSKRSRGRRLRIPKVVKSVVRHRTRDNDVDNLSIKESGTSSQVESPPVDGKEDLVSIRISSWKKFLKYIESQFELQQQLRSESKKSAIRKEKSSISKPESIITTANSSSSIGSESMSKRLGQNKKPKSLASTHTELMFPFVDLSVTNPVSNIHEDPKMLYKGGASLISSLTDIPFLTHLPSKQKSQLSAQSPSQSQTPSQLPPN